MAPAHNKPKLFVFGASGHAKVIIDIIEKQGSHELQFLVDDNHALRDTTCYGYKVIGGRNELTSYAEHDKLECIVAVGNNSVRDSIAQWLTARGFRFANAIHPSASIARGVIIGGGTVVMAGAVINSDSRIGDHVIINTVASVDHDCEIENLAHIAPGSHVCGGVRVGRSSLLGVGSVVIPGVVIGDGVTVGAGSTVINDVPDGAKVAGTPAAAI